MTSRRHPLHLAAAGLLAVLLCHAGAAAAGCSRPIVMPVSTIGQAVIVEGSKVSGVYPDVLREWGQKMGCKFSFQPFPRARSDLMFFQWKTSDLLLPATYLPERAQLATFVPLIKTLPTLVTLRPLPHDINTVKHLLDDKNLRGVVVRSFTFGKEYQELVAELEKEARVDFAVDITAVVRMLLAGRADFTVIPVHLLQPALDTMPEGQQLLAQVKSTPLEGLPRIESGVYISRAALSQHDQRELRALFVDAARSDAFVKAHQKYYTTELLRNAISKP